MTWKNDLALNGRYVIELSLFLPSGTRPSRPEAMACAIGTSVENVENAVAHLEKHQVKCEPVRIDHRMPSALLFNDPGRFYRRAV